jgi:hypothetical protein
MYTVSFVHHLKWFLLERMYVSCFYVRKLQAYNRIQLHDDLPTPRTLIDKQNHVYPLPPLEKLTLGTLSLVFINFPPSTPA